MKICSCPTLGYRGTECLRLTKADTYPDFGPSNLQYGYDPGIRYVWGAALRGPAVARRVETGRP